MLTSPITLAALQVIAKERFGDMVKAVVDVEKKIMAIGGELHADEEAFLLDSGSAQKNLWGINIYVNEPQDSRIGFDSFINIRPSVGNRSRVIEDAGTQKKIIDIVSQFIQ